MRKAIFLALLALIITSCGKTVTYQIRGTVDDPRMNGHKAVLYAVSQQKGMDPLDSTIIAERSFEFKGKADSADWYVLLVYNTDNKPVYNDFYLDGNVECKMENNRLLISGSDVNDSYLEFENAYAALTKEVVSLDARLKVSPGDGKLKQAFDSAYAKFEKASHALAMQTITENMDNPLGLHVFQATMSSLEDADIEAILASAPPVFLADSTVKLVISQMEMSKKVRVGQPCPDLNMLTPDGASMSLSHFTGKGGYVLIDFWASWCGPCMEEVPNLVGCYRKYHPLGLEIVGVSLDEDPESWKAAIRNKGMKWPQMSDLSGWKSQAVTTFSFSGIPHTVLVDPKGKIVAKDLRGEELKKELAKIYR